MIDKGIQIKNIFYMLSYSFRILQQNNYKKVLEEEFDNADDLLAEILYLGISHQIKQGLKKDYINISDEIKTIKGRINIRDSIKLFAQNKESINCSFDDFSENIIFNQILKSTIHKLIKQKTVKEPRKKQLKSLNNHFEDIDLVEYQNIDWTTLSFDKNDQTYVMLLNLCKMISNNLIVSESTGNKMHVIFGDKEMDLVFQNFVLNYYREYLKKNEIHGYVAKPSQIKRAIDYTKYHEGTAFLPELHTDITISSSEKTLIIDTKYYKSVLSSNFGKKEYDSANVNQIHEYVNQYSYRNKDKTVAGMLLYAKTDEDTQPHTKVFEMGHWFHVETLDLNTDFKHITKQLDDKLTDALLN